MSHLKSLTLTASQPLSTNSTLIRRQRFIDRLEEQRKLAEDPGFVPMVRRWKKDESGGRQPVDAYRRIKPWWRADEKGTLLLTLRKGLKTIELEKGKPAIVVGPPERLEAVLTTLIAATKAGELDIALASDSARTASKLTKK